MIITSRITTKTFFLYFLFLLEFFSNLAVLLFSVSVYLVRKCLWASVFLVILFFSLFHILLKSKWKIIASFLDRKLLESFSFVIYLLEVLIKSMLNCSIILSSRLAHRFLTLFLRIRLTITTKRLSNLYSFFNSQWFINRFLFSFQKSFNNRVNKPNYLASDFSVICCVENLNPEDLSECKKNR